MCTILKVCYIDMLLSLSFIVWGCFSFLFIINFNDVAYIHVDSVCRIYYKLQSFSEVPYSNRDKSFSMHLLHGFSQ